MLFIVRSLCLPALQDAPDVAPVPFVQLRRLAERLAHPLGRVALLGFRRSFGDQRRDGADVLFVQREDVGRGSPSPAAAAPRARRPPPPAVRARAGSPACSTAKSLVRRPLHFDFGTNRRAARDGDVEAARAAPRRSVAPAEVRQRARQAGVRLQLAQRHESEAGGRWAWRRAKKTYAETTSSAGSVISGRMRAKKRFGTAVASPRTGSLRRRGRRRRSGCARRLSCLVPPVGGREVLGLHEQVLEAGDLVAEAHVDGAGGAVAVLGDDHLGDPGGVPRGACRRCCPSPIARA